MSDGTFETHDGCRVAYVDTGSGVPVLWQHGLGATQAQVAEVFPGQSRFRRLTLECRGHGASELGPPDALSILQFADDALALLDHRGLQRAVVGGISLGAAIAMRLAVCYPERVSGLIIARPAWLDEPAPERMGIYLEVAELLERHGAARGLQRLEASESYRQVLEQSPDNAASMRGFFERPNPESTIALLRRIPAQGPEVTREQLMRLRLPTLIVANEGDYVHPIPLAETLAALIPGSRLTIIPDKHSRRSAYVESFATALAEFLSGLHER